MINFSFFNKKTKEEEKYLGLLLKEQTGVLMILSKVNGKFVLQQKVNFSYSNGWENLTEDVNDNLGSLNLKNEKIEKLIIFIYSHLVDQKTKQIQKPVLSAVKRMILELSFSPLGYVEVEEIVVSLLKEEENMPLNAILVEIDKTQLSIFVYKGDQIVLKKVVSRTDNFIDDLLSIFKEKEKQFLPSRMILYNSEDLDRKAEAVLSYRWPEGYFIQLPKVRIIKEEEIIKAAIFLLANQLKEEASLIVEKEKKTEEKLGFLIGKDINEESPKKTDSNFFKNLFYFLVKLPPFLLPKVSFKIQPFSFSLPFVVILLFLGGIFVNEWFFHRLSLNIYPETKSIEKEIVFFGAIEKETFFDKLKIITKEQEFKLSTTKKTTGEKEIGEKAKGEVTIFNSDLTTAYTLPKGTILISENGLKFVLEEEVKIASASGDASNPKPSSTKGKVVAFSIGSEYNLVSGNKFSIEGKSANLIAKNEIAFSGGSKDKIRTVSKDDLEELREQLLEKARTKAITAEKNKKTIASLKETKLKEEEFSKELGEEAEEVSLTAKVYQRFYFYDENQLKNRAIFYLQKELPQKFKIQKETIKASLIKAEKKKEDQLNLRFKINGKANREISIETLKKELVFVSKEKMADILKDKYKIARYDFKLNSGFLIFEITPLFDKNIEVKISY